MVAGFLYAALLPSRPLAEIVTVSGEPLVTVVEMVDVALPAWTADTLLGVAAIEKSDGVAQPGSWKVPIRVRQLNAPLDGMYSVVYQKVQPSLGSMVIAL